MLANSIGMQMEKKTVTYFHVLYAGVVLLALGLRVVFTGDWVLSEKEATLALNATSSYQTIYQVWTGLLFQLFHTSNFLARLLPIVFGTAFVLAPLMLRKQLGDSVALLIALGLAIDPGLLALSKQAGPEIIALVAFFTLILFIWQKKWTFAGISLALGLLSGSYFWIGLVAMILCLVIVSVFPIKNTDNEAGTIDFRLIRQQAQAINWKSVLISFSLTVLLAGTVFLIQPRALAGLTTGVVEFFQRQSQGIHAISFSIEMIGFFAAYLPILILGFLGMQYLSSGWRSITWTWIFVAFILVMGMPGRQLSDTIWLVIPLYLPAAIFLSRFQLHSQENPMIVGAVVAILGVFSVYFLYSLTQYLPNAALLQGDSQSNIYLLSAVISFVILALILVVLAWGWSIAISLDAARVLGLGFVLFALLVSGLKSAGFDSKPSQLMWFQTRYFEDSDIFNKSILQLDQNRLEKLAPLKIELQNVTSSSLLWELRDYELMEKTSKMLFSDTPSDVIITGVNDAPLVTENRTGQDFILEKSPAWSLMSFPEWFRWVLYQEPLYNNLQIVVWMNPYVGSLEVVTEP